MYNDEFNEKYRGRYYGKYKGIVVRVDDTKEQGRVIVKVPAVMGQEELGWALPAPPSGGGVNTGDLEFPVENDYVWVEFERGDPTTPIWSAGPWGKRDGTSMLMEHSRGASDDIDYSVRDVNNIPPSQFSGTYSNVKMIRSKSGSFLEFDSTPGEERVQLAHYAGSRIEMTEDGGIQEISTGSIRRRAEATSYEEIGGSQYKFVGGGRESEVVGNTTETYGADYTRRAKSVREEGIDYYADYGGGSYNIACGPLNIISKSKGYLGFANQLAFMVGQNLQMTIMENLEISASNATNVPGGPTARKAINLHGYNGPSVLKSTDITGLAQEAAIEMDGSIPGVPVAVFRAGVYNPLTELNVGPMVTLDGTPGTGGIALDADLAAGGGSIAVLRLSAANVMLGGLGAGDFVLKGTTFNSALSAFLLAITTAVAVGVGSSLQNAAVLTALGTAAGILSGVLPATLSPFVLTK